MRLLFLTDTHIRGTTPRSRTDDFLETLRGKLTEVIQIIQRENVDYVLHGGDVFDRPNLSPAVVREFAALFRQFQVPIYAIAGNHDIYGHNPDTVDRTMLGLLDAFGTIRLIREKEVITLEKNGLTVQLTGQAFHHELDRREVTQDYDVKNQIGANYCIHMVHGMLVDRSFPEGVAHTLIDHVFHEECGWDLLLTGHYHAGFPIQRRKGKLIVNPGALVRINNQKSEIQRTPQVALIDLEDGIQVRLIPLQCAQRGEEVLDRSMLEQQVYRQEKWAQFVQEVRAAGDYQGIMVEEIIEEISKLEGIETAVKEEALRRIARAQEAEGEKEG